MIICKYSKYSCIRNKIEAMFSPPSKVLYLQFYLPFLICRLFSIKLSAFCFQFHIIIICMLFYSFNYFSISMNVKYIVKP